MALVAEVWGTKDGNLEGWRLRDARCEIRGDICKVQACNCDRNSVGRRRDQVTKVRARAKGVQHVNW